MVTAHDLLLFVREARQRFLEFACDDKLMHELNPNALLALGETIGLMDRLAGRVAETDSYDERSSEDDAIKNS